MTKIYLIRHGSTALNGEGRYIGRQTDVCLNERGRREAGWGADYLRSVAVDRLWSSPLRRAVETAATIGEALDSEPVLEPLAAEVDFGAWDGKTFSEIQAESPGLVREWAAFHPSFQFPGGESLADFQDRIDRLALKIAAAPKSALALVTHGGVVRFLICRLLKLDYKNHLAFNVPPGSISELKLYDQGAGVLCSLLHPASGKEL